MSVDARALLRSERLANAAALCAALGIDRNKAERNKWTCPRHGGTSLSVRTKEGTAQIRCFGCDLAGDAFTLIAEVHRLDVARDFRRVLELAAEIANDTRALAELAERSEEIAEADEHDDETYDAIASVLLESCSLRASPNVWRYLTQRGIFADAEAVDVRGLPVDTARLVRALLAGFERGDLERAGVLREGRDAIDWPEHVLVIPWRDRFGRIRCLQRRALDARRMKYVFPRGRAPVAPFGVDLLRFLEPSDEIVIVEGALDCLARRRIARARGESAIVIGVQSSSSADRGLPLDAMHGRRAVIATDNDAAGDAAAAKIASAVGDVAREIVRERPRGAGDWGATLERNATT